ncbi:hypothetical protein OUZ56_015921 [Daphnia magna]|uniref:Uncharacterized protein n=1 Tax=Daphnia magna TaxID=35525 RepID=A0ABR0AP76_9CRUS|nr:hypothetical protein OUZ56_015921 [Daphnia magna]
MEKRRANVEDEERKEEEKTVLFFLSSSFIFYFPSCHPPATKEPAMSPSSLSSAQATGIYAYSMP